MSKIQPRPDKDKYAKVNVDDDDYSDEEDMYTANGTHPLLSVFKRTEIPDAYEDKTCDLGNRTCKTLLVFLVFLLCLVVLVVCTVLIPVSKVTVIGCDEVEVEDVWVVGKPKLNTESAFRLVDINKDGVLDVIQGFGAGSDGYNVPAFVCDIYFNGNHPCGGGVLALDGKTGEELWRHYTEHEVYALNCNKDLNDDGYIDCLAAGRAGVCRAICGQKGHLLWDFGKQPAKNSVMNVYTPVYLPDLDHDGFPEVLIAHGGDPLQEPGSMYRLSGRLIIMSGRTGKVLRWVGTPDKRETYYSPQLHTEGDGTTMVLFGTGGETHPGALWKIPLDDLYKGNIDKAVAIYKDNFKGITTPAVLVDMNKDGVEDILMSMYNSTTVLFDGNTYAQMWNYSLPMGETYSIPAVGYYNYDDTPDVQIKYCHGPGYPIYYYSETSVLNGKTGESFFNKNPRDDIGVQASGLTISMQGTGNDLFLYWVGDCLGHEGEGGSYRFVQGTIESKKSRSDLCKLRYNTTMYSKLLVLGPNFPLPGAQVYYSDERYYEEHAAWVNTTREGQEYLKLHGYEDTRRKRSKREMHVNQDRTPLDRKRRHIGTHDAEGIQRLISTGSLMPTLLAPSHPDYHRSIDTVFAVYWFPPSSSQAILPEDETCIADGMSKEQMRFDPKNKFYGLDHDNYERYITEQCLKKRNETAAAETDYDPYNQNMGQMTIYRLRMKFTCSKEAMSRAVNAKCAEVLPYEEQTWPAYMGRYGDSKWGVK